MRYSIERAADLIFGNKHPSYKKNFIKTHLYSQHSMSEQDFEYAKKVYNTFFKHQKLFKDNNLNPFNVYNIEYNYGNYDYEKFEDDMISIINQNKAKKLGKSVLRGYYNRLKDEETDRLLMALIINDIGKEELQKGIRKIAAFNNTEELNNCINKVINENGYTKEKLIKEINEYNNKLLNTNIPLHEIEYIIENDLIILNIKDYESSQKFGSPQWCISYDEGVFNEYSFSNPDDEEQIHGRGNSLFFIYDFSKKQDDPMFKISPLFSTNGLLLECFNQYDEDIEHLFLEQYFDKKVIYNFLEKDIKEREYDLENVDDFENYEFFLKNESYDPIRELIKTIEKYDEEFLEQLNSHEIFFSETYHVLCSWIESPYGQHMINKYPEKYLNNCLKIENAFSDKIINPEEKTSLYFTVLYNINREQEIFLNEKANIAYATPINTGKNGLVLFNTAIENLPMNESGVKAFRRIADCISRQKTKTIKQKEHEEILINKFKEFLHNENTKYETIKTAFHYEFMNSNMHFKNLRKTIEDEISTLSKTNNYDRKNLLKIEPTEARQSINIIYKNTNKHVKDIIVQGLEKFNETNTYDKEEIDKLINQIKPKNKTKKMRP